MGIYDIDTKQTLEESFLTYAGHVIQFRAIPDVRDGLKFGARQLLYSQFKTKMMYPGNMRKASASVGDAMKDYYVHGDMSCYGTYIRMAKPFALRYVLEETQGNKGSLIDPGNHAAARYVEMRGSELCSEMFTSLNKDTIDEWRDNYDQTTIFPLVLPSIGFYNIVNGAAGIAIGMATSIPQFNIRDVNNALIKLLNNSDATFEELYCPVDFATGGIVVNEEEVKESLKNGNGKSVRIRAKIDYDEKKNQLIISEMPYAVYTNTVCSQLEELLNADPIGTGIETFLDATNKDCCIKITLTKKANPSKVIDWLYKNTSLQNHYSINMIMLDNGKTPKLFGWVEALSAHLEHVKKIKRKEIVFDLDKAKARLHIVEGYSIALANLSEVVETIKHSATATEALNKIMKQFGFSEIQGKAVLDLKLSRLVNMESLKVQKEHDELTVDINRLENILADVVIFNLEIQKEIEKTTKKYGDARRTTNLNMVFNENNEPVEKKVLMVYFSEKGAIQAHEVDQYALQSRGGKGSKIKLREGDFLKETVYADNGSWVLIFTSLGKAHTFYLNDLKVGEETHIRTILEFEPDEEVLAILPYNRAKNCESVIIATINGNLKKSPVSDYIMKTKKAVPAIKLREGDSIASVTFVSKGDELLVVSRKGNCIRIDEDSISSTGRSTMGVQGIKMDVGNILLNIIPITKDTKEVCSISTNGLIKRTKIEEFVKTNRATKGSKIHNLKEDEEVAGVIGLSNEKEIMAISLTNAIRISLDQVPHSSRNSFGVSVMKDPNKITKIVALNT